MPPPEKKGETFTFSELASAPRLFTVSSTHKFLSFVIKTSRVVADSKCSQL